MHCSTKKFGRQDGKPYRVLVACRSSHQAQDPNLRDEPQLKAQETELRSWIEQNVQGSVEVYMINLGAQQKIYDLCHGPTIDKLLSCDLIIATSLERLTRNMDVFRFVELLAQRGIQIVCVPDSVGSRDHAWTLSKMLTSLCFETERDYRAQRARRVRRRK